MQWKVEGAGAARRPRLGLKNAPAAASRSWSIRAANSPNAVTPRQPARRAAIMIVAWQASPQRRPRAAAHALRRRRLFRTERIVPENSWLMISIAMPRRCRSRVGTRERPTAWQRPAKNLAGLLLHDVEVHAAFFVYRLFRDGPLAPANSGATSCRSGRRVASSQAPVFPVRWSTRNRIGVVAAALYRKREGLRKSPRRNAARG